MEQISNSSSNNKICVLSDCNQISEFSYDKLKGIILLTTSENQNKWMEGFNIATRPSFFMAFYNIDEQIHSLIPEDLNPIYIELSSIRCLEDFNSVFLDIFYTEYEYEDLWNEGFTIQQNNK